MYWMGGQSDGLIAHKKGFLNVNILVQKNKKSGGFVLLNQRKSFWCVNLTKPCLNHPSESSGDPHHMGTSSVLY